MQPVRPQHLSRARQLEAARLVHLATDPPPASHRRQALQLDPELEQEQFLEAVLGLFLERVLDLVLELGLILEQEFWLRPPPSYLATLPQPQVAFSALVLPLLGSVPPLPLRFQSQILKLLQLGLGRLASALAQG